MIVFLDLDGVLHPEQEDARYEFFCFSPLLWHILRSCPEAQVVFSTSWRRNCTLEKLTSFCTQGGGEDLIERFIGMTPEVEIDADVQEQGHREVECKMWLKQNGHSKTPWLAIDDYAFWFSARNKRNLYLTQSEIGMTEGDLEAIILLIRDLEAK